MTRAAPRIAQRTGAGRRRAPALSAARAWPASSSLICATMARDARVAGRKAIEVAVEMALDLALGLDQEAQAGLVAGTTGDQTDREGARVPQGVEQTGARAELAQALGGPGEMVGLLAGGLLELQAQRRIGRRQRLRAVQRLRADLADVIDPHQCAGVAALGLVEWRAGPGRDRPRPRRLRRAVEGAQGVVGDRQKPVERREGKATHGRHQNSRGRPL